MRTSHKFSETRLEQEQRRLRLVGPHGETILELSGLEVDEAVRAGFIDRENYHFSMFEYARILAIQPSAAGSFGTSRPKNAAGGADYDRGFLASLKICWD